MGRVGARLADLLRKQLCGIGAALFVVALVLVGPLERWEYLWFDQLFELRGPRPPTAPIVIVRLDDSARAAPLGT